MHPIRHPDDLAAWLRLIGVPGIGRIGAQRLLQTQPDPARLDLPSPPDLARQVDAAWTWSQGPGRRLLSFGDPDYPPLLRQVPDPPLLLYVLGEPALLQRPAVAIVGSRHASLRGMATAREMAQALADAGLCVVSGMALGIDGAAHEGALAAGGATVAVLGTGIDRCYPARHASLMTRLAQGACVVSEYALGTRPLAANFPQRNRIISGLARAIVVVEAAEHSGSLITARMAAEQGREVLAVPGAIQSPLARGCHRLIKEGAALAESAADVLQALGMAAPAPRAAGTALDAAGARLLGALGSAGLRAEVLAEALGWPLDEVQASLLELELAGVVERLPTGDFQLLKDPQALVAHQERLVK